MIKLEETMRSLVMEREREIKGMLCSLFAGEHIYVGGPPGSGKSYMGKTLLSLISGASDFANTFTAFSTPDEVVGPFDPSEIMKGNMIRNTAGMLPVANLARLEEIFKSNAGCLGILTDILVDGVFVQQGQAQKIPLLQALATSNELPQDDSLAYLWDRFAVRFWVGYLKSRDNRLKALNFRKGLKMPAPITSIDEVMEARKLVSDTPVSENLQMLMLDIQEELSRNGYSLSDRRLGRLQEVCHADMVIFGASEEEAAIHISDGAWSNIEDIRAVRDIVFKKANPELGEVMKLSDEVALLIEKMQKIKSDFGSQSDKLSKAGSIGVDIKNAIAKATSLKQTSKVAEALAGMNAAKKASESIIFEIVRG